MAYTVDQIKVMAYNCDEKDDFTIAERNLFIGLAYCYEWYRAKPEEKDACERLMGEYLYWYGVFAHQSERKEKGV